MPIEIKELIIKAIVGNNRQEFPSDAITPNDLTKLKKEIISEVTNKVFRALQKKNER